MPIIPGAGTNIGPVRSVNRVPGFTLAPEQGAPPAQYPAIVQKLDVQLLTAQGTSVYTVPAGVKHAQGNTLVLIFSVNAQSATGVADSGGFGSILAETTNTVDSGGAVVVVPLQKTMVEGDTVTVTWAASAGGRQVVALEYTGLWNAQIRADTASDLTGQTVSVTNYNTSVVAPNVPAVLVSAVCTGFGGTAFVSGHSGWTDEYQSYTTGTVRGILVQDAIVGAHNSQANAGFTWTGACTASYFVLELQAVTGPPASAASFTDSGTAPWVMTASAVENAQFVDSDTGAFNFAASATEVHEIPDSATASFGFTASAVESADFVDSGTATAAFTASATELHTTFDSGTGAWVLTASAAEVHTIFDAATATATFTAGGTEVPAHVDADTAIWDMTAYPDVVTKLFHDIFDRVVATDLGNATDGTPWVKLSSTSTDVSVDGTKGIINMPSGTNRAYLYKVGKPNADTVSTLVFAPSVLTSQASNNMIFEWRVRDTGAAANASDYLFRFLLQPTGNVQILLARLDAGVQATLVVATIVTGGSAGSWTVGDTFTAECYMVGTRMYAYVWRTAGSRPINPTVSYDTAGDATQYQQNSSLVIRVLSNALTTGTDQAWYFYSMDVVDVSERAQFVDSDTAVWGMTASAAEEHDIFDADTATATFTASAVETERVVDTDTGQFVLTAGGTEFVPNADSGTGAWVLTGSATEIFPSSDAATATATFTGSATEVPAHYDVDTGAWVMTAGTVFEGKVFSESATAAWVLTGSATELHTSFDSAAGQMVMTASAVEVHTIFDAATSVFTFTGSFAEVIIHDDSALANFVYTGSAIEVAPAADAGTGAWVMTALSFEEFGKIDSGTATWKMTISSINEGKYWADAATATSTFTTSGVEAYLVDSATAIAAFTAIPVDEQVIRSEQGTGIWNMAASGVVAFAGSDSGIAQWVLTPATIVDKFGVLDYYLTATQRGHFGVSQNIHFDVVQSGHYSTKQTTRWGIVYKGRGFLNG